MSLRDETDRHAEWRNHRWWYTPEACAALERAEKLEKIASRIGSVSAPVAQEEARRAEVLAGVPLPSFDPDDSASYVAALHQVVLEIRDKIPFETDPALIEIEEQSGLLADQMEKWTSASEDGQAVLDMAMRFFSLAETKGKEWGVSEVRYLGTQSRGCIGAAPPSRDQMRLPNFTGVWRTVVDFLDKSWKKEMALVGRGHCVPRKVPNLSLLPPQPGLRWYVDQGNEPPRVLLEVLKVAAQEISSRVEDLERPPSTWGTSVVVAGEPTTPSTTPAGQPVMIQASAVNLTRLTDGDGEVDPRVRITVRGPKGATRKFTAQQWGYLQRLQAEKKVTFSGSDDVDKGRRFVQAVEEIIGDQQMMTAEEGEMAPGQQGGRPGVQLAVALLPGIRLDLGLYHSPCEQGQADVRAVRDLSHETARSVRGRKPPGDAGNR